VLKNSVSATLISLLDMSPTNQLSQFGDIAFWKNHGITTLYLYIKPNLNPNADLIEYWQYTNNVYLKSWPEQ